MSESPKVPDLFRPEDLTPWERLRQYTDARIALGRVGTSLPTAEVLKFGQAHALARDAVHTELEVGALAEALAVDTVVVRSQAAHRSDYLRRPDLGRTLHPESAHLLRVQRSQPPPDILIMVSDGLSALSAQRQAAAVLHTLLPGLHAAGLRVAPVLIATQARVALADEAAALLGARLALHLIGERPGLSSPDSLGAYLTFDPRPGTLDSARNCVSNIRPAGLNAGAAARRLLGLTVEALRRGLSGVELKDSDGGLGGGEPDAVREPQRPRPASD
ncbi:ethanolamine ammonia-lyase subunit EutC [Deinococcus sp. Arct2-2]|uniref:ethanolamine ammonia-lyase subunit EutC n=1 Tax=Deinococcus sp. Arct2-2 TaxID=2568653 RepID=UPI0010A3263B|nr:ethanolamine ammonia-lyase subunit EutC [Deinococcus sp. Arct2-2]THF71551.1 ethanolamine ammonia-lyase subunit EutC [Deinococcus sp. Arct2-2]